MRRHSLPTFSIVVLFFLALTNLIAQEQAAPTSSTDWRKEIQLMELKSAELDDLRDWARRLELSTEGSEKQLRERIAEKLGLNLKESPATKRTVTIESAQSLSRFSLEVVDEDYIRITGGINIVLNDVAENTSHRITADTLLLNQTRNLLEARGNVTYTLTKASQVEVFRGEGLIFHLQDWMGIFYGGSSERDRTVGGATLRFRFEGGEIRRSGEDVVILNQGLITSSILKDPYYSIRASKIYILAPGEWGFSNAFLYIGRVPVFWFPIYFQPGSEMWFNPVVGLPDSSDRRGTYLQTTTYLFGRKKREDSPFSFLQFSEKAEEGPMRWSGLYLVRDPDQPAPTQGLDWTLKLIADLYTNLGFYTGLQGALSNIGILNRWDFLLGIAFSRNVYPGPPWKPFVFNPNAEVWEQSVWNRSLFLGSEVPFRYRLETKAQIQNWNLGWEYWADPFLGEDFGQRSETFTPFALIGFGPKPASVSESKKSSLSWFVGGSIPFTTTWSNPWIRSLSLSPAEVKLDFGLKPHPNFVTPDPSREWFHPSRFTTPNFRLNMSGEILRLTSTPPQTQRPVLIPPPDLASQPSAIETTPGQPSEDSTSPAPSLKEPENNQAPGPRLPDILKPATSAALAEEGKSEATLSYNWNGGWQTEGEYLSTPWLKPEDVDWRVRFARNQYNQAGNFALSIRLWNNFYQSDHGLSYSDRSRWTWYTNEQLTLLDKINLFSVDAQNVSTQVTTQNQITLTPLGFVFLLRQTTLGYSLALRLYEKQFQSYDTVNQVGVYNEFFPKWDTMTVSSHEVRFSLPLTPFEDPQLLNISLQGRSTLDPRPVERTLSLNVSTKIDIIQNTLSAGIRGDDKEWTPDLLRWTFEITPFGWRFTNNLEYDLKNERWQTETATLAGYGWVLRYYQTQTIPYYFDPINKLWTAGFAGGGYTPGQTYFLPLEASVSYQLPSANVSFLDDWGQLVLSGTASGNINLQQYTNANLNVTASLQLKVINYLDITFNVTSSNRSIYKYLPGLAESLGLNLVTVNPLEDILLGFAFWDDGLRKQSSFKLSRLSLSVAHLMPDWSLTFKLEATPRLEGTPLQYVWSTNYNIVFLWKPISEIKNDLKIDDKGIITVNTKQ
jgi:lipopolysaccharide assembly outer membrane protein LptD (OstA)